jgi:hypothetical protein
VTEPDLLPFVDRHALSVVAPAATVWPMLLRRIEAPFTGRFARVYARAVGCDDREATGPRPLTTGAAFAGFHVVRAIPDEELALRGHHRYSTYGLTFRIETLGPRRCRVEAETRAAFPGVGGRIYRLAVITGGGHAVLVRRLLAGLRGDAELADARG